MGVDTKGPIIAYHHVSTYLHAGRTLILIVLLLNCCLSPAW